MMRVLVIGAEGSAASYLIDFLRTQPNLEIFGTVRKLPSNPKYKAIQCDLTDFSAVYRAITKCVPHYIFNLASNADVKSSFDNPLSVMNNNVNATLNLFEAVRLANYGPHIPIIQQCSTSEVYGDNATSIPILESAPQNPANIYAISKLTQEKIAIYYYKTYGIPTVVTRAFSYWNPRRKNIFSTAFAIQIAEIEKGKRRVLKHGNLESVRTLCDVRDIVEAYWVASTSGKCKYGEPYNIGSCSWAAVSVGDVLADLVKEAKCPIEAEMDSSLVRPQDVSFQIPNIEKFTKATGWTPKISYSDSAKYLLEYCRENYV